MISLAKCYVFRGVLLFIIHYSLKRKKEKLILFMCKKKIKC